MTAPIDAEEMAIRRDLAACYRLAAHFGWDDLVATHISARLPGPGHSFLINPFGLLFEEITASSLVKIDLDGNILAPTEHRINQAAFVIHSAVHQARPEARCVIHLHTRDGVAVSATEDGILPLNQTAMMLARHVVFHEYEGVAFDVEERERLQADLGTADFMVLRNHGTMTVGESIASAFYRMYALEWACTVQVRTLSMGSRLHPAPEAAIAKVGVQFPPDAVEAFAATLAWPALVRKVQRLYPDYAS